jgi:beta-galactosidase GanA
MTHLGFGSLFFLLLGGVPGGVFGGLAQAAPSPSGIPALRRQGSATQLVVDGQPFLIRGGELGNSSASSAAYMMPIWPKLAALNLNTVLVPVYWELIEPLEGKFDFTSVGQAIEQARKHRLHVVLLWFGSWKNSMSSYTPAWVKRDARRFPRAEVRGGRPIEALSAFSAEGLAADTRAFVALMKYLRQTDGARHTVLMVQVENEVAMVEEAADRSAVARAAFAAPVPKELVDFLIARRAKTPGPESTTPTPTPTSTSSPTAVLPKGVMRAWTDAGARPAGTWTDLFGAGLATDEIFMAWHFARYVEAVARAGKAEYPLPMFANAALNRPGAKPGEYPSGGPLPHLYEVWRAGAPTIDFLAPDIYFPNFADWTARFARADNPLFVPEARNDVSSSLKVLYAIGAYQALGVSPFAIESLEPAAASALADSYRVIGQLTPLITAHQGRGSMTAVLLDKENPSVEVSLGEFRVHLRHDYTWEWASPARLGPNWPMAAAVIINSGPREYTIAGNGVIATFTPVTPDLAPIAGISGIERIEEGSFQNGKWIAGRRLNGDENHQGRQLRLPVGAFGIQRIWLYR